MQHFIYFCIWFTYYIYCIWLLFWYFCKISILQIGYHERIPHSRSWSALILLPNVLTFLRPSRPQWIMHFQSKQWNLISITDFAAKYMICIFKNKFILDIFWLAFIFILYVSRILIAKVDFQSQAKILNADMFSMARVNIQNNRYVYLSRC